MKYFVYLLLFVLLYSCAEPAAEVRDNLSFTCDAEKVAEGFFVSGEHQLNGVATRTAAKARSGNFSIALDKNQPFGLTYEIKDVKKGDAIQARIWKDKASNKGKLVIAGDDDLYLSSGATVDSEDEWGYIELFAIADKDYKSVKIYGYNPNDSVAYFDDLTVNAFFNTSMPEQSEENLSLELSDAALDTLSRFRDEALKLGVITGDQKEYVTGSIVQNGEKIPVEIRLKGDWVDHVETDKWSFRIKVASGFAYQGKRTFSIQNPSTRGFMREWTAHKLFEQEGVLTTTYKFVAVNINGESRGVFAMEEHFDKQLLESRKRREGPIVKFDESGIWQYYLELKQSELYYHGPALEAAEILPFKKNRTFKNPILKNQFLVAKELMERYRSHDPNVAEYLDIESMAKYLALVEVLNGDHGLAWHNQRFYFNPITQKLEVIAFDCFTNPMDSEIPEMELLGEQARLATDHNLSEFLVSNSHIRERYIHYLKVYSKSNFLSDFFKKNEKEISSTARLLQYEYPFCSTESEMFESNARIVKRLSADFEKHEATEVFWNKLNPEYTELEEGRVFSDVALKIYTKSKGEGKTNLELVNFHLHAIDVVGYAIKRNKDSMITLKNPINLSEYRGKSQVRDLTLEGNVKRIFYRASNCQDSVFKQKISKWPYNGIKGNLGSVTAYKHLPFVKSGNTLTLKKGNYKLNNDLIIPAGFIVNLEAGVSLDVTNSASFISYSPVRGNGSKTEGIHITSSDTSANGFTIVAPGKDIQLNYVHFNGLNTVNKGNWTLTGAVTIYEGDVNLQGCTFTNNKCEDGLNLIRCQFNMIDCTVINAFSDGFDADFCSGKVIKSTFENTGNDCIDFSGSEIDISSCTIRNAGDKAISGGEGSTLNIKSCFIDGAHIAVASKDLSVVNVESISILNTEFGFAAYRKKPEYGPASLVVSSVRGRGWKSLHLLEKGSKLEFLDKEFVGEKMFDIDSMYMTYSK